MITTQTGGTGGEALLAAHDIRVVVGAHTILGGVDLSVSQGEFISLIGANGAGKTTLLRVLLGLLKPTTGSVERPPRGQLGYLPQKVAVDPDTPMRARDVVALGYDGGRLGIPLRRNRLRERIDEVLHAVDAFDFADSRIGELSGGQQQRVLLAHAIVSEPEVLVLDEPLANLDPASANDIVLLLEKLRRSREMAILVTAHDLNLLLPVTDRIVYLADGRAVSGTPDEVVRSDVLSDLYGRPIRVIRAEGRVLVLADDTPAVSTTPDVS